MCVVCVNVCVCVCTNMHTCTHMSLELGVFLSRYNRVVLAPLSILEDLYPNLSAPLREGAYEEAA